SVNGPALGVKIEGATVPWKLSPPAPNCETLPNAPSVARAQSRRTAGLSELPAARMVSAYQIPVPEASMLDTTRCAGSALPAATRAAAAASTSRIIRQLPTVMIELRVLNSSELLGANGSATQRCPSTM